MRKRVGCVCMVLGLLFLATAIALVTYNSWDNNRAGKSAAEIQSALENTIKDNMGDSEDVPTTDTDEETGCQTEMDTVEINGYEYIGTLTISSLDLELPIMSEWSYAGMKITPGRYTGSAWTNDLVICGHNYTRHFGNLKYLKSGDTVYFTDVNGNIFYYEVTDVIILQPTAVDEMISHESGEWDLTLFTCTIGGQTRVTVRCSRTN